MRTTIRLAALLSTLALAACGGGGGDPVDAPGGTPDAPAGTPDAPPGPPDADPTSPDAAPGAFTCNGQPNPTNAADPINITGRTVELAASGTPAVPNTTVDLFAVGNPTAIATTTSAGTMADFAFNNLATGGTALDGYLRGTFPDGRKTVYVYPPQPIFRTTDNIVVTSASASIILVINAAYATPDQSDANGAVGVLVTDCLGNPLAGATVNLTPAGTQVLYRNAAGQPDPAATSTGPDGIGIVFNVPPGNVVIDAAYQSYDMREHTIAVRTFGDAGDKALTTTIVVP